MCLDSVAAELTWTGCICSANQTRLLTLRSTLATENCLTFYTPTPASACVIFVYPMLQQSQWFESISILHSLLILLLFLFASGLLIIIHDSASGCSLHMYAVMVCCFCSHRPLLFSHIGQLTCIAVQCQQQLPLIVSPTLLINTAHDIE